MKQSHILTKEEVQTLRHPLPYSWKGVAGLLKGKKHISDPVAHQKKMREEWEKHLKKQHKLANS